MKIFTGGDVVQKMLLNGLSLGEDHTNLPENKRLAAMSILNLCLGDVVRAQRNALLTASDWTQVADAPVDQAAWATYRQALRDIPAQAGFPDAVTWPEKP